MTSHHYLPALAESELPPRRGCGGVFFVIMIVFAGVWGAGLGVFLWILDDAKTTIAALEDFRPKVASRVYSYGGHMLGEFAIEARQLVALNEIPLHVQKAFIATEDHPFYEHKGVRPLAIASAALDTIQTNVVRGGSTITQQIPRNVETTGITKERTLQRKIREALVALQLERQFTKDEILELYLNQIFLGVSAHGVEAAARQYYAKSIRDVTLAEAALLAGLARAPNRNEPIHNPENARIRRDIVLAQMLEHGFITREDHDAAVTESVEESVVTPEERKALEAEGKAAWSVNRFQAPYFVEEVRKFVSSPPAPHEVNATQEELFEGGLEIYTTIDLRLQRAAEEILTTALEAFDADKLEDLKRQGKEDEFMPVSGALVCLDNRQGYEGFVRAMVGGRDFDTKKFNLATQAQRQPGSSVKPFVWLAAIDQGMTASDIVVDEPYLYIGPYGTVWQPKNFDPEHLGPITLRHALEKSVNIVSVKLVERFSMPLVRSYLQDAGFRLPINDDVKLTLALGTPVTTVLDQAVCYSTLALGGVRVEPTMVLDIKDRDGFSRYDYTSYRNKTPVFAPDAVYAVVHLMEGVCQADRKRGYYPTGWRTEELARPRAGKTGTTNKNIDIWFCGFTPQFTCVVWMGYEDNRPLGRGNRYTGGFRCSPIWTEFMKLAHEGLPVEEFRAPPGVEFYDVDRFTGVIGGEYHEAFIRGAKPPTELPEVRAADGAERILDVDLLESL